jgi:hypothetical protein
LTREPVSSGHSPDWLKSKNPAAPAAKREAGVTVVDEIGEDFPTLFGDYPLGDATSWGFNLAALPQRPQESRILI